MQVQDWKEMVAAGLMVLIPDSWTSLVISLLVCICTTLLVTKRAKRVKNLVASRYPANPRSTVDFLSLCAENVNIIENLVNDGNLLNKRQCLDLSIKLSKTIQNIQELVSHCGATLVLSRLALETLYRTLEKAKLLVKDCDNEDWCRASIYQIQNENAFREILLEVGFCYHAICEQVKGTIDGCNMHLEDLCQSSFFQPASVNDIHEDQQELRERLERIAYHMDTSRWSGLFSGSLLGRVAQKHCLAQYLLDKFKCLSQKFQTRDLATSGALLLAKDSELTEPQGSCDILGPGQDGTVVIRTEWFGVPAAKKLFLGGGFEVLFLKEAAILAHLNHPRIVNFYCCGNGHSKGDAHFIAMELLETSLFRLIEEQSKPFSLAVAVDIMVQIARGMCYLHDVGVAHRDLKPQNVVVNRLTCQHLGDEYFCVKLVDFGMSKTKVEVSKYNSISFPGVGTTRYRAPEVHPKAHPDSKGKAIWFKADVHSFAMTCYHILSLKQPYEDLNPSEMYEEQVILGRRPEFPTDCPKVLVSLLRECWDPEPRSRPYFIEICSRLEKFRHDLLRGLVGLEQGLQEPDSNHSTNYQIIEEKLKEYSSVQSRGVGESDDNIEDIQTQSIPNCGFMVEPVTHVPDMSSTELSLQEATSSTMSGCHCHDMLPRHSEDDQITERTESLSDIPKDQSLKKYRPLSDFIGQQSQRLPLLGAVEVMMQISEGMLYLHDHGVTHRDLKPLNVLVTPSSAYKSGTYSVMLADFGLSMIKTENKLVGRPFYSAPETLPSSMTSLKRAADINWFKADVYSFGIVCQDILSISEDWIEPTKRRKLGTLLELDGLVSAGCSNLNPLSRPDFRAVFYVLRNVYMELCAISKIYGSGPYYGLHEVSLDPVSYGFTRKVDPQLLMRYGFKEPVTRAFINEQGRLLDELMRFRPSDQEPKHQILLNHCDADSSFVELLRKDLEARNVESLVICSSAGNVSGATRPCCVEICVISDEYLSSECSILELAKYATECRPEHHILYPLFYKLSAHDLIAESNLVHILDRWSKLAKTVPGVNLDQLTTAIDQLTSFALSANGSSYNDSATSEFGCRKSIVKDICKLLPPYLPYDTSNIIGCDRLCKELSGLFLEHNNTGAQILGLYGVAGLGKTALSKALCNYFQKDVSRIRVCRLEFKINDRVLGKRGAKTSPHVQLTMLKMVLRTLLGCDEAVLSKISSVSWGLKLLQAQRTQQPVFLVLDNVSYETQVEASAYLKFASFHAKSKVLVIARSQDVLKEFLQDSKHCKPMPELTEEEAANILLKYGHSSKKYTGLTRGERVIVMKCLRKCYVFSDRGSRQYHPLVLAALGEFFGAQVNTSEPNITIWEEHLHFLLIGTNVTSKSLLNALIQWYKDTAEQPTASGT